MKKIGNLMKRAAKWYLAQYAECYKDYYACAYRVY